MILMDIVGSGANTSHGGANDQKCIESGGYHLIHHSQNHPMSSKSTIIRITFLFIAAAAAVACLALYHSAHSIQYFFFPTSYNPFSSSISHEFTKLNQFSSLSDNPASGNFSSPPDDSSHGNSFVTSNIDSSSNPSNSSSGSSNIDSSSNPSNSSDDSSVTSNLSPSTSDHPVSGNFSSPPDDSSHGNSSVTSNIDSSSNPSNSSSPTTTNTVQENLPLPVNQENEESKLDKVLSKAAMENKTVIITTLNAAWSAPNSIFDLFLESFKIGIGTERLLNHVVVIAFDQKAHSRCLEVHPHCYAVITEGVDFSGEAYFMSTDYLKMMWRRIDFLHTVLQMGYNFIFTDADIMWFRDPFSHFYSDADFQIACDFYWSTSTDLNNLPNGGFNYVLSNNRSIQFYKFWYTSKDRYPGNHDQDVLNMIKFDPFINEIGLKIRFLDTAFYGGFCETSKDLNFVCTMHANCCKGLDNKIHDLKMLIEDWKKYMALSSEQRTTAPPTWTVPRICPIK